MATQEAAVKSLLTSSSAWATLITGGTFTWDDLPGGQGFTPDSAAAAGAYDAATGALKPSAVITFGTDAPHRDIPTIAEERFLSVWLYDQQGFANIRAAKRLLKSLLHYKAAGTRGVTDTESINHLYYVNSGPEYYDAPMGDVPASFVRFQIVYVRS